MVGLRYREDFDEVRDRLAHWWAGQDIGRPALQLTVPRSAPRDRVPALPEPAGWVTHYSTKSFDYRVNLALRACAATEYLAEAVPCVAPDLGPNCLALYLGCRGEERPGTVWFHPCIEAPETARFALDEQNPYWAFTLRLARAQLRLAGDRFLTSFPDLIEGLDTLAAMRGTQKLLVDLIERPDWVHAGLDRITELYFECYDRLYDAAPDDIRAEVEALIGDAFDDGRGLIVSTSASPYIHGAGERCYPQYEAMVDAVIGWRPS